MTSLQAKPELRDGQMGVLINNELWMPGDFCRECWAMTMQAKTDRALITQADAAYEQEEQEG